MKSVRVCFTDAKNLGDAINPLIIEHVLGYHAELSNRWNCRITGIGSGLRRFFVSEGDRSTWHRMNQGIMNALHRDPVIIWSAGFLSTPKPQLMPIRKCYNMASVRGVLSKRSLQAAGLIQGEECTVGDAGILASYLIPLERRKTCRIGLIPHRKEKDLPIIERVKENLPDVKVIDIEPDDPLEGLAQIAGCEYILSSSLHGLIFADSFRIPNRHIILSDNLSGDGFKFRDYYSVYALEDQPIDMRKESRWNIEEYFSRYEISDDQVYKVQENCKSAFFKFLK